MWIFLGKGLVHDYGIRVGIGIAPPTGMILLLILVA
jgi:hypothetical protein